MASANLSFLRQSMGESTAPERRTKTRTIKKPDISVMNSVDECEELPVVRDWAEELKDLPDEAIKKAWFTTAHLLLDAGSHVVDMGCGDGSMAYAMAVLQPNIKFTAVDRDGRLINAAKKKFQKPNLRFEKADITKPVFEENSVDAIINSFILHKLYSAHGCNEGLVSKVLQAQYDQLKDNGLIFIRDYSIKNPEDMVLLEMPDVHSDSDDPETMSDPALLEYYSEQARAMLDDRCCGFPLEELPPRYPGTKLYRLPYKWAYEFIMRNDQRENWVEEIVKEYTFSDQQSLFKSLSGLGTRVLYTAPYWNNSFINTHYLKHFRMYDDDGKPLGAPPTSFISLAKKLPERKSLALEERRTAKNSTGSFQIHAMRNEQDGSHIDIASRDMHTIDVIPYRIGANNRLKVFLHDGAPRPIMNTIPRNGKTLDEKRWSGHMTEAICIDVEEIDKYDFSEFKDNVKFCRDYLGLKPALNAHMEDGPSFFPAPDFIDDRVETRFINVQDDVKSVIPKYLPPDKQGFSDVGEYREFDAQDILDAIAVGLIPLSRLEIQIMALFNKLKIKPVTWAECPLVLEEPPEDAYDNIKSATQILQLIDQVDKRFKDIKGSVGDLRVIPSVFVDEGREKGGIAGLASREMDFVVSEEKTQNTAIVLPLSRDHSGEILACMQHDYMPVPQRYTGSGKVMKAPSIDLPKEIRSIEDAKRYIAEKFGVGMENVAQMGEPYFSHIGMTPRRIFPFAITGASSTNPYMVGTVYAPLSNIAAMLFYADDFMIVTISTTMMRFCLGDSDMSPATRFSDCLADARQKDVSTLTYGDRPNRETSKESSPAQSQESSDAGPQSPEISGQGDEPEHRPSENSQEEGEPFRPKSVQKSKENQSDTAAPKNRYEDFSDPEPSHS